LQDKELFRFVYLHFLNAFIGLKLHLRPGGLIKVPQRRQIQFSNRMKLLLCIFRSGCLLFYFFILQKKSF